MWDFRGLGGTFQKWKHATWTWETFLQHSPPYYWLSQINHITIPHISHLFSNLWVHKSEGLISCFASATFLHNCINLKFEIKPSCRYNSIYAKKIKIVSIDVFWPIQIGNLKFCTTTSTFVFILPCFHLDTICWKIKDSWNHTLIWYGCLVSFLVYITNIWTLL